MTEKEEQVLLQIMAKETRKRRIIIAIVVILVVVIAGLVTTSFVSSSYPVTLLKTEMTVEYGEPYEPTIEEYIAFNKQITPDNTKMSCNLKNEKEKAYAAVGEYTLTVSHTMPVKLGKRVLFQRPINKKAKITVKDTTAPVFSDECQKRIELMPITDEEGAEALKGKFSASDLSGNCKIKFNIEDVSFAVPGEYPIKVTASDKYKNSATFDCVVVVLEPELAVSTNEVVLQVGEKTKIVITHSGDETPVISVNDTEIATMSADGTIKAGYAGKTFATISCAGLTEIVNIKVTPLPVEQISERETTTSAPETTAAPTQQETTSKASSSGGKSGSSSGSSGTTKKSGGNSNKKKNKKYKNKDFLFEDGYTMDNVAEAATDYLMKSGRAGRCIPLKNDEGVYIGMRVEFDD